MKSKKILLFTVIILFVSIFTRFHNLENFYMVELDDTIAPEQLIAYDKLDLYDIANDTSSPSYGSKLKNYLRELEAKENSLINFTQKNISKILFNLSPVKSSTYAPLQYFIFGGIVDEDQSYNDKKFYSRLPSAIFSVLTILITYLICRKIFDGKIYFLFLPSLLLVCSYPMIYVSQKSYNYSAGIFATTLLFYLFLRESTNLNDSKVFIDKSKIKLKKNIYFSFILALTSYLNYICIVLMPVFFIFNFIKCYFKNKKILTISNYNLVICGFIYSLMIFPLLLHMINLNLYNYGATDSSGIFGEYSIVGKDNSYIKFFLYNFYLIVAKNLSFFLDSFIGAYIIQGLIFFITLIGVSCIFLKNVNDNYRNIIQLFIFILFYWIVLVFFNQTTFGPTKQLLWLTPVITIIFTYGVKIINKFLFKSNFIFSILTTASIIVVFILNYSNFLNYHKDLFDEKNINSLIKKHNIQFIVNNVSYNHLLCLMPSVDVKISTCPIRYNRYSKKEKLNHYIYKQTKASEGSIAFINYNITDKIKLDLENNGFKKSFVFKDIMFPLNKSPLYIAKMFPNLIEIIIYK